MRPPGLKIKIFNPQEAQITDLLRTSKDIHRPGEYR
jgi:hypothetical protein